MQGLKGVSGFQGCCFSFNYFGLQACKVREGCLGVPEGFGRTCGSALSVEDFMQAMYLFTCLLVPGFTGLGLRLFKSCVSVF